MSLSLESFLSQREIKHGLPAEVYIDEEFRKLENEMLFPSSWVFVGFAHELKRPGDVIPVTVAGKPFFLVRNADNEIAAFHNVCRHRCLKLIDEPRSCGKLIVCPYHSWTYALDGSLKAAPYFEGKERKTNGQFPLDDHGLVPVRCETWYDWVFINIDGKAPSLAEHVRPLQKQLEEVDLADIVPVATLDFGVLETNWKGLMENFIEPYHVQFVHKTTTTQPLVDHFTIIDEHCLGSACDIAEAQSVDESGTLAVTSRFLTLFPNFVMGTYAPDQIGIHLNVPVSATQTSQRRVIYLHKNNSATSEEIQQISDLWYDVHKEDHEICERLQQGRMSDIAADGGRLSPFWEDSVRRFQELVVESVSSAKT